MTDQTKPDTTERAKPRMVPCPSCQAPALFSPESPFRPFCSARCQGHDFGAWAKEAYRVGTQSPPPEDQE